MRAGRLPATGGGDADLTPVVCAAKRLFYHGVMTTRERISVSLAARHGLPVERCHVRPLGGGATGATFDVDLGGRRGFLKWLSQGDALEAEADGLVALSPVVRVPKVIDQGPLAGGSGLLLEWLSLAPVDEGQGWPALGRALRALHDVRGDQFGYHRDNWIGASPQINTPDRDWARFFVARRLAPQLRRARDHGLDSATVDRVETVMARVPGWLSGLKVEPSLVHGDLWQGNVAGLPDDTTGVVLFDPAVYYGDAEVDLAMLSLFGRVPENFYHAYGIKPGDADFQHRARLYNLYHLLNHFNLFGGGYAGAVSATVTTLLRS